MLSMGINRFFIILIDFDGEFMKEASKITFSNDLNKQFNWFYCSFLNSLTNASEEFFEHEFLYKLISVSENLNPLFQGDNYFVSKVIIDKQHEIFIRSSEKAVSIILDKVLGKVNKKFSLNKITNIEAQIITTFNDFFYNKSQNLFLPVPNLQKRKNFDTIHLTFFVVDNEVNKSGKIIISLPKVLLNPQCVGCSELKFNELAFKDNCSEVNIKIGSTVFFVKDLKTLEPEDIIVLRNSNINFMKVKCDAFEKEFNVEPNTDLIIPISINEGEIMSPENVNLWDSIQVEMGAEFEKIKMTLGDLKKIEEGLVVDISSIYKNQITLRVENKVIALGELVIINDRYGVKITKIFADNKEELPPPPPMIESEQEEIHLQVQEVDTEPSQQQPQVETNPEDEFDYSDFELDDEDL